MVDDGDDRRDRIDALLQEMGPGRNEVSRSPEGSVVCTGWVLVADWMDETGERWIARGWSSSKAKWEVDGMLHEALYGDWSEDEIE